MPYDEQQLAAVDLGRGVLALPDGEMAALAERIKRALSAMDEAE